MKTNFTAVAVFLFLTPFLFTGCAGDSSALSFYNTTSQKAGTSPTGDVKKPETIRISWWGNQIRNENTLKIIQSYNKNKDYIFKGEYVDWNGYWKNLELQSAANSLPDIIQMDYSYIRQYADKNLLADLSPYAAKGILDLENIPDNFTLSGMAGGKLTGIPLGINALVMYYDPEIFKEAGLETPTPRWTWDIYYKDLSIIHSKTGKCADPLYFVDPILILEYMVRQQGNVLYSETENKLGFTDPAPLKRLFEQVAGLTRQGIYLSLENVPVNTRLEDLPFVKGRTFMGQGWSNQYVAICKASKRQIEMVSPPLDGTSYGLYNKPSMFFSVSENSAHIMQCIEFIDYFINDMEANTVLLAERGVPISSTIRGMLQEKVNPASKATFDYIDKINYTEKVVGTFIPPAPVKSSKVGDMMKDLYNQVAFGVISPDDAALLFMKNANEILSGNP